MSKTYTLTLDHGEVLALHVALRGTARENAAVGAFRLAGRFREIDAKIIEQTGVDFFGTPIPREVTE